MKPLNPLSAKTLLERIDNAANAELRSVTVLGPVTMQLRMSVQDRNRGFDWIDLVFEVDGVADARLVDDAKLAYVDTDEGISLIFEGEHVGFGVGSYATVEAVRSAPLYMIGRSMKCAEAPFWES